MIVAEGVVEEGPTLIQRPGSDDIAGQKVTRAAVDNPWSSPSQVKRFCAIHSGHQVWHRGCQILCSLKRSQIFDLFLIGGWIWGPCPSSPRQK